ncbi:uncharacterized protein NFIA_006070 [Aspergillus fischeri NRRL 181]|uniref:Uncharacterized protein n=1 Tax=Neosartorya fischeri (strain ATCC 1020 / DSM 3700 / CBS 544.65 / FGSC A1164 / JCM 1740 / NRRL 181 / WB 181) TaxID=331117 RepID=A1DKK4_NEOFI|nr:uncharacterized protein NFIA_006070 [Aspergillus fischeri NRRL 181]EAW17243.1 hypothetical protein NFIA_006070 [Aspergillus fischeri NRRL 181]KAG2004077.1 hypothetical protein GB937_009093 [Aspergillus fischeri]
MSTSTASSTSTYTTTTESASSSTTSSSPLPGQESTTPTLTSATATSLSSSGAVSTSTSIPGSPSASSPITSVTSPSISLNSSSTIASSTASSTATNQPSLPQPSPNNVSRGALAGAIVGCIIGTAALTILGAFLFFRRRKKGARAGRSEQFSKDKPPQHPSLHLGASASSLYTPHPADDETVRARILTLFDHASLHVDNYYSSAAASSLHDPATSLASYESPYLPSPIATLLAKPGRHRAVLTHILVRELLQQITPGSGKGGLLPACYASCPQVVNQTPETDQVLFKWRMLTAYLYQRQQGARDVDEHAISGLAEPFVDVFTGYANPAHTRAERLQHLRSIASAAAELGRWLFAQPCAFEFVWDYPGRQGMVITPRVVKVCDEQGRRLVVPQVMAEGTSL